MKTQLLKLVKTVLQIVLIALMPTHVPSETEPCYYKMANAFLDVETTTWKMV